MNKYLLITIFAAIIVLVYLIVVKMQESSFKKLIKKRTEYIHILQEAIKNELTYYRLKSNNVFEKSPLLDQYLADITLIINDMGSCRSPFENVSFIPASKNDNVNMEDLYLELQSAPSEILSCVEEHSEIVQRILLVKRPFLHRVEKIKKNTALRILAMLVRILLFIVKHDHKNKTLVDLVADGQKIEETRELQDMCAHAYG